MASVFSNDMNQDSRNEINTSGKISNKGEYFLISKEVPFI
jgi:hypothetical protein